MNDSASRFIAYNRIQVEQSVSVAPTSTVILQPTQCDQGDLLSLKRTNNDGAQTLNEQVEAAHAQGGPWSVQSSADLQGVAPGETRIRAVAVAGFEWVRTTGTASGAGLNVTASTALVTT